MKTVKQAAKRKRVIKPKNNRIKIRKKYKSLPDLDIDFICATPIQSLDDQVYDSFFEESLYTPVAKDNNTSEDDSELIMTRTPVKKKSPHYESGDLAWVKNDRKCCYWPAYIKSVSKKRISILYICYNKFIKEERAFTFTPNTTRIKPFDTEEHQLLVKNAREWCETLTVDEQEKMLKSINEALELAETYTIQSKQFTADEKFEFFKTMGYSYYHKKSLEEKHTNSPLKQLPNRNTSHSSVEEQLHDRDTSHSLLEEQSPNRSKSDSFVEKKLNNLSVLENFSSNEDGDIQNCLSERTATENVETTTSLTESKKLKKENKCKQFLYTYNKRNANLVKFILNGKCDKQLLKIFNHKTSSARMKFLSENWSGKENKNFIFGPTYFQDEKQLKDICVYLENFIQHKIKDVNSLVKRSELLFHVFLPEATVYAIAKVRRRTLEDAEEIYSTGFKGLKENPQLTVPLKPDDRESFRRRYFNPL